MKRFLAFLNLALDAFLNLASEGQALGYNMQVSETVVDINTPMHLQDSSRVLMLKRTRSQAY